MSSLVSKVTSDDTQPIPMYTLKELAELTQKSVKDCESVRSALLSRLGKSSPDIKFKALRSIKYICAHGRVDFKLAFQRDNSVVKTLLQFSCPPDDLRGEKPAENVRAEAQECMEAIYADNQASAGSGIKVESMGNNMAAHYQSSQQQRGTSTYQGFGTAPPPKVEESITGFNIRKTISSAILGSGSSPPNHIPSTQSKYGGLSSNSYSQSSYSHYTHNPSAQPQHQQPQQQPQQPQPQQPQQQNNNGVYSGQGFSPNGVFGGSGSSEAYAAAQAHGYETYNSSQNPYSSHQQSNAAGLNKTGPWGSKAGNAANSFNQPQNQQHPESFHHQPPHTQTQRSIPNQPYTSRTGPTTKDSVEDLAFEKRIVAQYTANTPLKPNLTDVELKKFTTESSACAVDDILTILYNTFSNAASQPSTLNKAVQIYSHLIVACGMTADECDADHINFIHQLYETTPNKHTKGHCEKMLAALELIQVSDSSTRTSQQVSGFIAQPQPVQEQTFQQPQQPQQQQQQQQAGNNNVGGGDVFDFLSGQSQPTQTQQSDDLSSSFGFMNVDEQPQQTSAGAKKPMFSGLQVKPKTQQQQQQQGSGSAFDFLDAPAPQQQQTTQSNDLFALLGTSQTPQPKGGLDLDSLYAASAQTTTQQPKQQDMFAAMQPAPPPQQQHQQQQQQSSFDFMTSDNTSNKHNDDVFGDLLSSPQRSQQPNPPPQQPAVNNTNSFDFVDAMF